MIYTAKEISISRAVQVLDNENIHYLKKKPWYPVINLKKHFELFRMEFNEIFNENKIRGVLKSEFHKTILWNKINNILPSLYYGLVLSDKQEFKDTYKFLFGKEPKNKEDYDRVLHEKKRLTRKFKNLNIDEGEVQPEGIKLGELVASVETILGISIDRSISLTDFNYQYQLAVNKSNQLKKAG